MGYEASNLSRSRGAGAGRAKPGTAMITRWLLAVLLCSVVVGCGGPGADREGRSGQQTPLVADVTDSPLRKSWAGTHPSPDFPAGLAWFNVAHPLSLEELRGKVVLLDFWTQGCINCQHVVPDLKQLEDEFGDALVVIGVHSGKYATEHEDDSIREAVGRLELEHPVVNDPEFVVWNTFGVNAWPTLVLIDPAGNLVGGHAGEGVYPLFRPIIASLVEEFEEQGAINRQPIPLDLEATSASSVLAYPAAVVADEGRNQLFIADSGHNRILVANLEGALQSVIGSGEEGFADGPAEEAMFRQPQGLALSPDGQALYVADTRNHAVRAVDLVNREVRTIAGTGQQLDRLPVGSEPAKQVALASPWDVLQDGDSLYISIAGVHQIWRLDLTNETIQIFAGTSREGIQDGPRRSMATLAQPSGMASDGHYLYWVDPESSAVRRVPLAGESDSLVETLVGTGLFDYGDEDGVGTGAKLQHAQGLAYHDGQLFIGDTYNHKVRRLEVASLRVTTLAGNGTRGWDDGQADYARFDEPAGVSIAGGLVYVADQNNHLIRTVEIASGETKTLLLSNLGVATASGPAEVLRVELPRQEVATGAASLGVVVTAPEGHHLNSSAPSQLELRTSNAAVVELGEHTLQWQSDAPEMRIPVPVMLAEGEATVEAEATLYYCREGEAALCFIQRMHVTLPLTVREGATSLPQLQVDLPKAP